MKAAVIREHGGPEVVKIEQIPDPHAGVGEVVINVRAAALNHLDIWTIKGGRGPGLAGPHVIGSDCSGVVAQVGQGVVNVKLGAPVIMAPGLSCGRCEWCQRGQQSECATFGIIGLSRDGTYAQKVVVPAANLQPKPAHLSFEEAAALSLAHVTAWRMVFTRAALRPGEDVLIHGIGGGVSLAALQLARMVNARVIVTSSSDEKLSRALAMGAEHGINYKTAPDIALAVRDYTAGRGVDVAIDTVGAATFPIDVKAVRKGGRIVLCGVTTGAMAQADLRAIYWNQLTIMGSTGGSHEDYRRLVRAVEASKLRPVVDTVMPLDKAREALERLASANQFGKIVLLIAD